MTITEIINGDLLTSNEKYIAQQCNCVTVKSSGLAKSIATKYPYADIYTLRNSLNYINGKNSIPGTINISYPDLSNKGPNVVHMFAQYFPGKPKKYSKFYANPFNYKDDRDMRLEWFKECLYIIEENKEITRLGMPYQIGCGLAGGNWNEYLFLLNNSKIPIFLYKI